MSRPSALVVRGPGTNRDHDAAFALDLAGAEPRIALVGELVERPELVREARLIVVAGGFSYADALGAGRLLALDLSSAALGDELAAFVAAGRPVLGICNGFQALVRSGLLPGAGRHVALGHNESGRFDCRWVSLTPRSSRCIWTSTLDGGIDCPIAHGEGRFTCDDETFAALTDGDQIALTYAGRNPNGSRGDVAGICDPTGVVLGLMPHPENHVVPRQHPRAGRATAGGLGLQLFEAGVRHAKEL
ncbi:MAG: phosphoribosylformylglycinamidine synthase I [Acidimicrobiia bacterium]